MQYFIYINILTISLFDIFKNVLIDIGIFKNSHINVFIDIYSQAEKNIDSIKSLVERLPPANHHLLRHILFILNETAENNQVILNKIEQESVCLRYSNYEIGALAWVLEFYTLA